MLEDFGSIISPIVLKDDSTMGPWKMAQAAMATFDKAEYWPDFFITPTRNPLFLFHEADSHQLEICKSTMYIYIEGLSYKKIKGINIHQR